MGERVDKAQAVVNAAMALLSLAVQQEATEKALDRAVQQGALAAPERDAVLAEESARFEEEHSRIAGSREEVSGGR